MTTKYFTTRSSTFISPSVCVIAYGDLNNDGLTDILLFDWTRWDSGENGSLRAAISKGDGTFYENNNLIPKNSFVTPFVKIRDLNGDGFNDIAVFDSGTYFDFGTHGKEPVLYFGSSSGVFSESDSLKVSYRPYILTKGSNYQGGYQIDLTMGVKGIDVADIDGDGDLDFWVESTGGANLISHFLINAGKGSFSVDINNRITNSVLLGPLYNNGSGPDYFRYGSGTFVDLNSDGKPDLILGQIRDNDLTHINQSSFALINDGKGFFPSSSLIRLPLPNFYFGYTSVQDAAVWDINKDGLNDLVLLHTRNDGVTGNMVEKPWTGTYIQVLINGGDKTFIDKTDYYIGDQRVWSSAALQEWNYAKKITLADINGDSRTDFLLTYNGGVRLSDSTPIGFWSTPTGTFRPIDSFILNHGDAYFGEGVTPLDINNDKFIDFVHLDENPGPNGTYEDNKSDDFDFIISQIGNATMSIRMIDDISGVAAQAYRLYQAALDRIPDDHGLSGWIKFMNEGGSLTTMAQQFIDSQEFKTKYGALDNSKFVNQLYLNVLDRNGEPAGIAGWVNGLANGLSRAEVLKGFSESSENQANVIGQIKNGIPYVEWWLA